MSSTCTTFHQNIKERKASFLEACLLKKGGENLNLMKENLNLMKEYLNLMKKEQEQEESFS